MINSRILKERPVIKAVIFDLDGTLIDYEGASHQALTTVTERYDPEKPVSWDLHANIVGRRPHGPDGWARGILSELEFPEHVLSESKYIEEVHEEVRLHFDKITPMKGALELVERLAAKNIPIAIATSSVRKSFDEKMSYHKRILELVQIVVCGDDPELTRGKPNPDIFLLAAARLGIKETNRCIVFEDSPAGLQAAKAANMFAVAIPDARFNSEEYYGRFEHADWILSSLLEFDEEDHICCRLDVDDIN